MSSPAVPGAAISLPAVSSAATSSLVVPDANVSSPAVSNGTESARATLSAEDSLPVAITYPSLPLSAHRTGAYEDAMDMVEKGMASRPTYPPYPASEPDVTMREQLATSIGIGIRNAIPILRRVERSIESGRNESPILPMTVQQASSSTARDARKKRRDSDTEESDVAEPVGRVVTRFLFSC